MRERDHKDGHARTSKRGKHAWLVAVLLTLLVVGGWFLWAVVSSRDSRSADERLAEIEAARAIPDSENAATIYNQLLQDPNAIEVLSDCPAEFVDPPVFLRIRHKPWLGHDYPPLVGWISAHQYVINKLLEASRLEKCRFPLSIDIVTPPSEMDRTSNLRQWGFLLVIAANNDLAEGRTEDAMMKWRCLLRMGSHWRQHPTLVDHLVGSAITLVPLEPMARFVVTGNTTESCLREVETLGLSVEEDWAAQLTAVHSVEDLRGQKLKESLGAAGRLGLSIASFLMKRTTDATLDDPINKCRCSVRGVRILIAMKRYKLATDRWPQSLDEIKPSFFQGTLTDPINGGPFVYRPAGSAFELYSRGKNNIDEHGKRDAGPGPDDWLIWPPRESSPAPKPPDANSV